MLGDRHGARGARGLLFQGLLVLVLLSATAPRRAEAPLAVCERGRGERLKAPRAVAVVAVAAAVVLAAALSLLLVVVGGVLLFVFFSPRVGERGKKKESEFLEWRGRRKKRRKKGKKKVLSSHNQYFLPFSDAPVSQ